MWDSSSTFNNTDKEIMFHSFSLKQSLKIRLQEPTLLSLLKTPLKTLGFAYSKNNWPNIFDRSLFSLSILFSRYHIYRNTRRRLAPATMNQFFIPSWPLPGSQPAPRSILFTPLISIALHLFTCWLRRVRRLKHTPSHIKWKRPAPM